MHRASYYRLQNENHIIYFISWVSEGDLYIKCFRIILAPFFISISETSSKTLLSFCPKKIYLCTSSGNCEDGKRDHYVVQ